MNEIGCSTHNVISLVKIMVHVFYAISSLSLHFLKYKQTRRLVIQKKYYTYSTSTTIINISTIYVVLYFYNESWIFCTVIWIIVTYYIHIRAVYVYLFIYFSYEQNSILFRFQSVCRTFARVSFPQAVEPPSYDVYLCVLFTVIKKITIARYETDG